MLTDFPVLQVDAVVRRTLVSSVVVALVALAVTVLVGQALAGVGVLLGLGGAVANHRLFQLSTVRYSTSAGRIERKPYFGSVAARLGALTVIAFALLYFVRPMGFGMVGGLVIFQVLLMANALAAVWRYQRAALSGSTLSSSTPPPSREPTDGEG
jgi:hypothetical protein